MQKTISYFIFSYLLLVASVNAKPKLFTSDWPAWNLTLGMHQAGMLEDFDYRQRKYESSLKWFKAGNLDITFMTLYDFVSLQPTKLPTVILGVTDYSYGGDKIIVRNDIKKPQQLKGKKILLASNTISLWFLYNYLNHHGLSLEDVTLVNQSESLIALQFVEDLSFSAVVGWNPSIERAITDSSYVASSSADFPRAIYDLIVAKQSIVDDSPELVESFLSNYYLSIHKNSILEQTAEVLSIAPEAYRSWLSDAKIFSSRESANKEYENLLLSAAKIQKFLNVVPGSLDNPETRKRFKQRNINFQNLITFKPESK